MRSRLFYTLYQWQRHRVLGWTLTRWLFLILLLLAFLTATGVLPGRRIGALLWVSLALVGWGLLTWAHKRAFITFSEEKGSTPPVAQGKGFPVGRQHPVRVTGRVEVGEQTQMVVDVSGYVERFANGEWVVAAVIPPSRYAIVGALPWRFEGMWYRFLHPRGIIERRVGWLQVRGGREMALEIRYRTPKGRAESLYLSGDAVLLDSLFRSLHGEDEETGTSF